MPKGVEHNIDRIGEISYVPVRIPLMPKGVEHMLTLANFVVGTGVRIPLMPKGVEQRSSVHHLCGRNLSEDASDAQRR